MAYILLDLNVRDPFVSDSTDVMLKDTKVVIQGLWRLLTTEEGEIPNFRSYGLNVKQFSQYPLTRETANMIYEYVLEKIKTFETRVEVLTALLDADFEKGQILITLTVRVIPTGEVYQLPTWRIGITSNA